MMGPMRTALMSSWLTAAPLAAQAPPADLLLVMNGADTIAAEQVRLTGARLDGELLFKVAGARFTYTVHFGRDFTVSTLENAYRPAASDRTAPAAQTAVFTFVGDSVIVAINPGPGEQIQRLKAAEGAIPFLNPSFAMVEIATRRARRSGGDSYAATMFTPSGGQTFPLTIRRNGADSMIVSFSGVDARLAVDASGTILGGTIPAQGLTIRRVRGGGGGGALETEAPDYSAPPGAPYTAETVKVPTPMGHVLAGTLTVPRSARGKLPAVVTITGSGLQDRDEAISLVRGFRPFRQIADTLGRAGIAVLRMDDRGFGGSGGNAATATSKDLADDIRAGVAYLRTRPEIDPDRIALVGHSEGGIIAPMVAASDPRIKAIVLMAGTAKPGRTVVEYQNRNALDHQPNLTPAARDSMLRVTMDSVMAAGQRAPWVRWFLAYDPLPTARKVRIPTLILQGGTDQQVTPDQAETLAAAIRSGGNTDVTVRVFPNANHLFIQDPNGWPGGYIGLKDREIRGDVIAALVDWLKAKL